jgi:hypothetical protein
MKRKLTTVGLCAVAGLAAIIAFSGQGSKRAAPPHSLVVTQAGRLTLVPNPAGYAAMTLVVDMPKAGTNAPPVAPDGHQ